MYIFFYGMFKCASTNAADSSCTYTAEEKGNKFKRRREKLDRMSRKYKKKQGLEVRII